MMYRKVPIIVLSAVVTVVLLYVLLSKIELEEIYGTILHMDAHYEKLQVSLLLSLSPLCCSTYSYHKSISMM